MRWWSDGLPIVQTSSGELGSWYNGLPTNVLYDEVCIVPTADAATGNWTDQSGGTSNLFQAIDDAVIDDSDFIKSGLSPSGDIVRVKLASPASSPSPPFVVNYRTWKSGQASLAIRLKQGTTVIHEESFTPQSTPTGGSFTLTAAEFAGITDFTDLYLEFEAS